MRGARASNDAVRARLIGLTCWIGGARGASYNDTRTALALSACAIGAGPFLSMRALDQPSLKMAS